MCNDSSKLCFVDSTRLGTLAIEFLPTSTWPIFYKFCKHKLQISIVGAYLSKMVFEKSLNMLATTAETMLENVVSSVCEYVCLSDSRKINKNKSSTCPQNVSHYIISLPVRSIKMSELCGETYEATSGNSYSVNC